MARDRSKPWGHRPDNDPEHTESDAWDDEATQGASRRRAPRRGSRRNDDETNVGGSLLPGDDFGLAAVFEQALAPAYVNQPGDEVERTEPGAAPAAPVKPKGAKPSTHRAAPPRPPEIEAAAPPAPEPAPPPRRPAPPSLPPEEDLGLGPVEEFTISGLMPDELKAMTEAAREAIDKAAPPTGRTAPPERGTANKVHADPPRTSRHDPDPLITGVLAAPGGPPPGQRPGHSVDDEETLAMNVADHPELLDKLRPKEKPGRDYHTFGAGLQRLDQLPEPPKKPSEPTGGGILELLDGAPPPASPTGPNPAPGAPATPVSDGERPRRVSTNRAGSMGRGRAPTPKPARQRSVAPNPKGATPRPSPARESLPQREALRRSGGGRGRPKPSKPPPPGPRPTSAGRALDEEARIRAALASVSEDEHTSWVKLDEPELAEPAKERPPGNRPRAQRPEGALPGVTPIGMPRQASDPPASKPSGLTMDLSEVKPSEEPTRPVPDIGDEATIPNPRSSLGDEVTVPVAGPGDDPTMPVKVPNSRAQEPTIKAAPPPSAPPAAKPPPAKPPGAKPPPKKPNGAAGAGGATKSKPPVDISPLGDDKPESYRDGALPWIASMFAVMVIGSGVIFFLILLLYLI